MKVITMNTTACISPDQEKSLFEPGTSAPQSRLPDIFLRKTAIYLVHDEDHWNPDGREPGKQEWFQLLKRARIASDRKEMDSCDNNETQQSNR